MAPTFKRRANQIADPDFTPSRSNKRRKLGHQTGATEHVSSNTRSQNQTLDRVPPDNLNSDDGEKLERLEGFPKFATMPPELQNLVWNNTVPSRIVLVKPDYTDHSKVVFSNHSNYKHPASLSMKEADPALARKYSYKFAGASHAAPNGIRFCYDTDTLMIPTVSACYQFCMRFHAVPDSQVFHGGVMPQVKDFIIRTFQESLRGIKTVATCVYVWNARDAGQTSGPGNSFFGFDAPMFPDLETLFIHLPNLERYRWNRKFQTTIRPAFGQSPAVNIPPLPRKEFEAAVRAEILKQYPEDAHKPRIVFLNTRQRMAGEKRGFYPDQ